MLRRQFIKWFLTSSVLLSGLSASKIASASGSGGGGGDSSGGSSSGGGSLAVPTLLLVAHQALVVVAHLQMLLVAHLEVAHQVLAAALMQTVAVHRMVDQFQVRLPIAEALKKNYLAMLILN